jgi:tetratricopeptide (TPR) repeat protein
MHAGRFSECAEHAARAVELFVALEDRVRAGAAAATGAQALIYGGDNEAGLSIAQPWWDELSQRDDAAQALLPLSSALAQVRGRLGLESRDLLEAFVQLAESSDDAGVLSDAYTRLGLYYSTTGTLSVGRILMEAAANLSREHHQPQSLVVSLNNLAASAMTENLAAAVEHGMEGQAVSLASGLTLWYSFNSTNLLIAKWWLGDWDDACRMMAETELSPEDVNENVWLVFSGLVARTRDEDPVRDVAKVSPAKGDDPVDLAWEALARSLVADRAGDSREAVALSLEAVAKMDEFAGVWDDMVTAWCVAIDLAIGADDDAAVGSLLSLVDGVSTVLPPGLQAHRHRVGGILALRAGDLQEAESQLRTAVEAFGVWGARPYQARAQAELAICLRMQGNLDEATAMSQRAGETLRGVRAVGWLRELDLQPAEKTRSYLDTPVV